MRSPSLLALSVIAGGCVGPTSLRIDLAAAAGVKVQSVSLHVTDPAGEDLALALPGDGGALALPGPVFAHLPDAARTLTVEADATDQLGRTLVASGTVESAPHREAEIALTLGGDLPPGCRDGMLDGDERDLDCGGSCPPCGPDRMCAAPADCATASCASGRCVLASGPPSWRMIAQVPTGNFYYAAAAPLPDGRVAAMGGTGSASSDDHANAYRASSDAWDALADLPAAIDALGAALAPDGRLLAIGGADGSGPRAQVLAYDPAADAWSDGPPLAAPRAHLAAAVGGDGTVYALGGGPGGPTLDTVETLAPGASAWTAAPHLIGSRNSFGAAGGADGRIYVTGGYQEGAAYIADCEVFDPIGGAWSRIAALPGPRTSHAAAAAPDGRIYVVGGYAGGNDLDAVYAYSPDRDAWDPVADFPSPREGLAAAVGGDGRIYAVLGTGSDPPYAYGPVLALSLPDSHPAAGDTITVKGTNFAASAPVEVDLLAPAPQRIASATTDGAGAFSTPARVPSSLAAGSYRLRAADAHSRYPVTLPIAITPDAVLSSSAMARDGVGSFDGPTEATGDAPPLGTIERFQLQVVDGPSAGRTWESAADGCSIGSHPSNDLQLEDRTVSRFHCEIRIDASGARVRDLGSKNATQLDGISVVEAFLRDGSILRIGRTAIRFQFAGTRNRVQLSPRGEFGSLIGSSPAMRAAFSLLEHAAASDATVLIEGETGTGKEGAAEAIHLASARAEAPFMVIDCGAVPHDLLESELFGHERGAFTGASARRLGAFEEAAGGTVFLDEIGELPTDLQPKLLRVLEQREFRRIGSNLHQPVDVRVIAATHRDLRAEVNRGAFRPDLYFRIAVVKVPLPPLRARPEDLPLLVERLLDSLGAPPPVRAMLLAPELVAGLARATWPGNVRELRNYLERCIVFREPLALGDRAAGESAEAPATYEAARRRALSEFERSYVEELLRKSGGKVAQAARAAGIDRVYLYQLMRRHGFKALRAQKK